MQHTLTRRRRLARRVARGVTLMEVLIVVAIISLIAGGVAVAVLPKFNKASIDMAMTNARSIRATASQWRALQGSGNCPTVSQLIQEKELDSAAKTDDPWGMPYKISCTEDETIVTSFGPDKKEGTADDIRVPKGAKEN